MLCFCRDRWCVVRLRNIHVWYTALYRGYRDEERKYESSQYSIVILFIRDICKNYLTGNDIQFYFYSSVVSTKIFAFISNVFILFDTITSYNLYLFIPSELMLFVQLLITDIAIRFIVICNLQHELSCLIYLHMQF